MTEILILSRSDLRQLISFSDYVDVVADAFQLLAQGQCQSPVPTEIREDRGTFHIKPGSLPRGAGYVAVKINGNFPSNRASCGLPTIQGAVYLADSSNGRPLALLDSMRSPFSGPAPRRQSQPAILQGPMRPQPPSAAAVSKRPSSWLRCGTCSIYGASSPGTLIAKPRGTLPLAWLNRPGSGCRTSMTSAKQPITATQS